MRTWTVLPLLMVIAGCATPSSPPSCVGLRGVGAVPITDAAGVTRIRYTYADEAVRLPHLQCRADQGDRTAMVELARALETGSGVVRDDSRAATLYEKAAQDRPTFTSIYSPPVRLGGAGQVMMIPNTDGGPGNAEAKHRLGHMLVEGRGIARDPERGRQLIAEANGKDLSHSADAPFSGPPGRPEDRAKDQPSSDRRGRAPSFRRSPTRQRPAIRDRRKRRRAAPRPRCYRPLSADG